MNNKYMVLNKTGGGSPLLEPYGTEKPSLKDKKLRGNFPFSKGCSKMRHPTHGATHQLHTSGACFLL